MYDSIPHYENGAIGGLGGLGNAPCKSFSFRQLCEIDSFEDHGKSASGYFDGRCIADTCRQSKGAAFETLEPDGKAIAIPVKDFHQGLRPIHKDKEMTSERIVGEF